MLFVCLFVSQKKKLFKKKIWGWVGTRLFLRNKDNYEKNLKITFMYGSLNEHMLEV